MKGKHDPQADISPSSANAAIQAENPVMVVEKVVDRRGTHKLATAYIEYRYSDKGRNRGPALFASARWEGNSAARRAVRRALALHRRRGIRRLEKGPGHPLQRWRLVRPDFSYEVSKVRNHHG